MEDCCCGRALFLDRLLGGVLVLCSRYVRFADGRFSALADNEFGKAFCSGPSLKLLLLEASAPNRKKLSLVDINLLGIGWANSGKESNADVKP